MASPDGSWNISAKDLEGIIKTPMLPSLIDDIIDAEHRHIEEGIRRALGLWVSELEPQLMFLMGKTRPFGITARGHNVAYVRIDWDKNLYLTGEAIRFPIRRVFPAESLEF